MQTSVFNVEGITNTNSATALRDAVTSLTGVSSVSVDIDSSKLTVTFDQTSTDISEIKDVIANNGFDIQ